MRVSGDNPVDKSANVTKIADFVYKTIRFVAKIKKTKIE